MSKTMSVFFDLPSSLQLEILSSWLNFPGDSKESERNLMALENAANNKTMRDSLRDVYGRLDWEGYFCSDHYFKKPKARMRWLFARRIRFTKLVLTKTNRTYGDFYELVWDFIRLLTISSKLVKVIKVLDSNVGLHHVMECIFKNCKVLETLVLDGCGIILSLATVLKKCPTITDLRVRELYDKSEPANAQHAEDLGVAAGAKKVKKSVFADLLCPNIKKFALLHTIDATEAATAAAAFPDVVELALKGSECTDVFTAAFGAWRKLETVTFVRSKTSVVIDAAMCAALQHSAPTLRKLHAQCNLRTIDLLAFESLLSRCKKLTDICFTFTVSSSLDTIRELITMCNTRLLHLNMYEIKHLPADFAVLVATHCPNLRTLASRGLRMCRNSFLILENCTHLEKLYTELSSNCLNESLQLLSDISKHCHKLQLLCLCYAFCGGKFNQDIYTLVLTNTHLRTVAVESRDIYRRHPKLRVNFIDYKDCMKSDLGIQNYDHNDWWIDN